MNTYTHILSALRLSLSIVLLSLYGIVDVWSYTPDSSVIVRRINPDGVFKPATYSQAVIVEGGRTIITSGIVAQNEQGEIIGKGNIRVQTEQALANVKKVLQASGATFADVVKLTYYVVHYTPEQLGAIREIRARYLDPNALPASTLVGVSALYHPDVLIEIEAIAVLRK
jgi:enamine deaminase RidA (YjgF/YER057c/UK114 family)